MGITTQEVLVRIKEANQGELKRFQETVAAPQYFDLRISESSINKVKQQIAGLQQSASLVNVEATSKDLQQIFNEIKAFRAGAVAVLKDIPITFYTKVIASFKTEL